MLKSINAGFKDKNGMELTKWVIYIFTYDSVIVQADRYLDTKEINISICPVSYKQNVIIHFVYFLANICLGDCVLTWSFVPTGKIKLDILLPKSNK